MRPCWVSIEGVEGVGKTYLARRLASMLGSRCRFLGEVTDRGPEGLVGQVVAALSRTGDVFLRTGHPLTETFALLALKTYEHEHQRRASGEGVELILEDRGFDTVAVYQAIILGQNSTVERMHALAQRIYAVVTRWWPPPDVTLLLTDDLNMCAERFAERIGRRLHDDELALMDWADQLYTRQATADPHRFVVIRRSGVSEEQTLSLMYETCRNLSRAGGRRCAT